MNPVHSLTWASCARTHTGLVRKANQDAFVNYPAKGLWIVADGVGGHNYGEIASNAIVAAFKQFEAEKTIGVSIKKIYQELEKVNDELVNQAALAGENSIIGSTVVVLHANQNRCVVVWSGDSRLYLFRRGRLTQITRDHNNELKLLAEGLSAKEVKVHPYAQILIHAIGEGSDVYLDAQTQEFRLDDVFLLCSDGLNKEILDSEIETVLKQMPYQQALNYLMDLCLQRGGRDNITIVLAKAIRGKN